jgi:transcriptional regulator GlxA family with amidase domain
MVSTNKSTEPPVAFDDTISSYVDHRVYEVLEFMLAHVEARCGPSEFADHVRVSPRQLSRLFLRHLNATPCEIFKLIRMKLARDLLGATHLSVKQVAARAGFWDVSHFVRDFTRLHGCTPSQYRRDQAFPQVGSNDQFSQRLSDSQRFGN